MPTGDSFPHQNLVAHFESSKRCEAVSGKLVRTPDPSTFQCVVAVGFDQFCYSKRPALVASAPALKLEWNQINARTRIAALHGRQSAAGNRDCANQPQVTQPCVYCEPGPLA